MRTTLAILGIPIGFIVGCTCTLRLVAKNWDDIRARIEEEKGRSAHDH